MTPEAHVKPAPNAAITTTCPSRMVPFLTASSNANGIDAAEVLPYRSTLIMIPVVRQPEALPHRA